MLRNPEEIVHSWIQLLATTLFSFCSVEICGGETTEVRVYILRRPCCLSAKCAAAHACCWQWVTSATSPHTFFLSICVLGPPRRGFDISIVSDQEKKIMTETTLSIVILSGTTWTGDLKCREVKTGILRLSLAEIWKKHFVSLYGAEYRERGCGLRCLFLLLASLL